MSGLSLRLLGLGCAFVLVHGCADGGGTTDNSGFTSVSNPTQVSSASQDSASDTSASSTGAGSVTTSAGEVGDASSSGGAPDPTTTTGVDGTTTTGPVDPSTTTGPVDPSTTTGPVDPSTTTGADDTTGVMTTMTTMTTDGTTTDEPPPPPKDAQPVNGLYESCKDNTPCDPNLTDGCFMITDQNDVVIDGYCTILCNVVADCGPKLNVPAIQECFAISADQKVCGLKCTGVKDCPTGMACTNLTLPGNKTGMYCT